MKKTDNLKEFEENILAGERTIKESYPLEEKKKMVVCYTLSKVLWRGDEYDYANPKIAYCCEEAVKGIVFQGSNVPSPGCDPANFKRMVYQGKAVDSCPFCGAEIVIEVK